MYSFDMEILPGLMEGGYSLSTLSQEDYKMLLKTSNIKVHFVTPKIIDGNIERGSTIVRLIIGRDNQTHAVIQHDGETYNFKYRDNEQVIVCSSHTQLIGKLVELHNIDIGHHGEYIEPNDFLQKLRNTSAFSI